MLQHTTNLIFYLLHFYKEKSSIIKRLKLENDAVNLFTISKCTFIS